MNLKLVVSARCQYIALVAERVFYYNYDMRYEDPTVGADVSAEYTAGSSGSCRYMATITILLVYLRALMYPSGKSRVEPSSFL